MMLRVSESGNFEEVKRVEKGASVSPKSNGRAA
jgi:hypothetical protein